MSWCEGDDGCAATTVDEAREKVRKEKKEKRKLRKKWKEGEEKRMEEEWDWSTGGFSSSGSYGIGLAGEISDMKMEVDESDGDTWI